VKTWIARTPVTAFVALTMMLTWAAWLPLLAQAQGFWDRAPWSALHLLGSLGPAAAAVIVVAATRGRTGLVELARRAIAWRTRRRARAFVLCVPPVLLVLSVLLAAVVDGRR
jgi:hypothetical protein